jgi:hypothetical protein
VQPLGQSHFSDALKEPMREHALALRGVTKKIGTGPRRAKSAKAASLTASA